MGYSPQDVNAMSIFQYMAACEGFARANGADGGLTAEEEDELWNWLGVDVRDESEVGKTNPSFDLNIRIYETYLDQWERSVEQ